jgi:hypothetical protein
MTSICLMVYQESVSKIYKNPGSLINAAGITRRIKAIPIKTRSNATMMYG